MLGLTHTHTQISLAQRAASYGALPISVQCGRYFLSSDSLGLLIQKADGRRWVDGCRSGRGTSRCLGCVLVVSRLCLHSVSVVSEVFWWCLWCLGSVSVMSPWCSVVPAVMPWRSCLGGVLVVPSWFQLVPQWCLDGV